MKRANESSLAERQSAENRTLKPHFLLFLHFLELGIRAFSKTKNPRKPRPSRVFAMYPGRESNPHSLSGNRILSPACLPVPPPGQLLVELVFECRKLTIKMFTQTKVDY